MLGLRAHHRFDPSEMVTRGLNRFSISRDVEEAVPITELRAITADTKLRAVGEHTGATLLDPVPDICGNGESCSPFFGAGEPKFSDGTHPRPIFVRKHLHFLDPLLK